MQELFEKSFFVFFVLQYFIQINNLKISNFSANIQPIKYLFLVLPEAAPSSQSW